MNECIYGATATLRFFREAGSKSKPPFHHDISYFDFEGSMCVLWIPLETVKKEEGIAWIKGSHLWNRLFLRTRFNDGHNVAGVSACVIGKAFNIVTGHEAKIYDGSWSEWALKEGLLI